VAFDAKRNRLYVASQGTDNLLIVDVASGKVLHDVPVGAGALNVAFEPVSGLAYVTNRGAGTVTVVDGDGAVVGNMDGGTFPNHVREDGKGNVFAVNKSRGAEDPKGDRITRITPTRR
jgi:YVTN family beta-propeller protein